MNDVIIIGGGVAGLSAGASLASKGIRVRLFESRPFLGGRIYSFTDPVTGDFVDNGQHIFAGFYYNMFKFLSLIGSSEHIVRQKRLLIDFIDREKKYTRFECPYLPSPIHLIWGLLRYPEFPKKDLFKLLMNGRKVPLDWMSAADFLESVGQSLEAERAFFSPLVLATLNADLNEVSGRLFYSMLESIFSVPAAHSVLAYSTVGFSELISGPSSSFIMANGGEVNLGVRIERIRIENDRVVSVVDSSGREYSADAFIVALPPDALLKIVPEGFIKYLDRWTCSPIVSVNIWYDRPVTDRLMVSLLDGCFHWFFDKSSIIIDRSKHKYVTLLASSAYDKIALSREQVVNLAIKDMNTYFPEARSAKILHTQVIKERKATVLVTCEMNRLRAASRTPWQNCLLAGDWVDTGLPATVESAVKSGFDAAKLLQ